MAKIEVLKGIRFTPEMFLKRMKKSKKLKNIEVKHMNTVYSLCWIFQYRILLQASKNTTRYAGYYGGYDESVASPGKLALLPAAEEKEVPDVCILADKLTEEEALKASWEYNKRDVTRKFRNLYAPPVLEDHKTDRYYKPLYIFEFYNKELDEKKYRILDSLTGDLDEIQIME
jgi:hypothetical protein